MEQAMGYPTQEPGDRGSQTETDRYHGHYAGAGDWV